MMKRIEHVKPRSRAVAAVVTVVSAAMLVGVVGVPSALAASPEFKATATGGSLSGVATTNQVFTVSSGSSEKVTCEALKAEGEVIALEAPEQEAVVQYEKCSASTFLGTLSATISAAHYTFYSDGEVAITKPIEINIGGLITQTVTDQTVGTVTYNDHSGELEIVANVSGIHSEGGLGTQTTGTYTGTTLVKDSNAELSIS